MTGFEILVAISLTLSLSVVFSALMIASRMPAHAIIRAMRVAGHSGR